MFQSLSDKLTAAFKHFRKNVFGDLAVDGDPSGVAGLLGHGTSFDESGVFKILVYSHVIPLFCAVDSFIKRHYTTA